MTPAASRFRDVRLALGWGATWGPILGLGLLTPPLLDVHRLEPETLGQWGLVGGVLLLLFVLVGAPLNVVGCLPLAVWRAVRRRDFERPGLAFALATPPLLVGVYLGWAALLDGLAFRGLSVAERDARPFWLLLVACASWSLAAAVTYSRLAGLPEGRGRRVASGAIAAIAGAALLTLPARVRSHPPEAGAPAPLAALEPARDRAPTLFVGLDGACWRAIGPLVESGRVPFFRRLLETGVSGNVGAIWPPYWSGAAWAAIVTGYPREETGIYEDLAVLAPGLPPYHVPLAFEFAYRPVVALEMVLARQRMIRLVPPPRSMLRRSPVWELLARSGKKAAVVRFGFTFPASGRAAVVVSDWAGTDSWARIGVEPRARPEEVITPPAEAVELLGPFLRGAGPPLSRFVAEPDRPRPVDAAIDPLAMLEIAAAIDARTLEAAARILERHPDSAFLSVYLGGLDNVMHSFWQYRFPEDFPVDPPASGDVAVLGPVVDRYLEWLDEAVAGLARRFPEAPNVVVTADHGYEATVRHALWRGWHSARGGVFLAGGPDVPRRPGRLEVSYLDVAPTLLRLAGFVPPGTLRGKPLF